jgi:WD40 repeat protein
MLVIVGLSLSIVNGADSEGTKGQFKIPGGEPVQCIAYGRGNETLVIGTSSGSVWLWEPKKDGKARRLTVGSRDLLKGGILSAAVSPDGNHAVVGCADRVVRVIDIANGKVSCELVGHDGPVWGVSFCHNQCVVISGSTNDCTIRTWDLSNGKELASFKAKEIINCIAIAPDDRFIATTSFKQVEIWNRQGKVVRTLAGHQARVEFVAWSKDGRSIFSASVDGCFRVWNGETGECVREVLGKDLWLQSAAVSPSGRFAALAGVGEIQLWNIETGKRLMRWTEMKGAIRVAFSRDSEIIFAGDEEGCVRLFTVPGGREANEKRP